MRHKSIPFRSLSFFTFYDDVPIRKSTKCKEHKVSTITHFFNTEEKLTLVENMRKSARTWYDQGKVGHVTRDGYKIRAITCAAAIQYLEVLMQSGRESPTQKELMKVINVRWQAMARMWIKLNGYEFPLQNIQKIYQHACSEFTNDHYIIL